MTLTQGQKDFVARYTPYAQIAAKRVFWNPLGFLAQWADETGWGTSPLVRSNNLGGIHSGPNTYAAYPNLSAFADAAAQVMYRDSPALRQYPVPADPKDVLMGSSYNPNKPQYPDLISEIWNELKADYATLAVNYHKPTPPVPVEELVAQHNQLIQQMQSQLANLEAELKSLREP